MIAQPKYHKPRAGSSSRWHDNERSRRRRTTDRGGGPQGLRQDPEGQTHGHTHDTSPWDHSHVLTHSYLPDCTPVCARLCTHMLRVINADSKKKKAAPAADYYTSQMLFANKDMIQVHYLTNWCIWMSSFPNPHSTHYRQDRHDGDDDFQLSLRVGPYCICVRYALR